MSSDDRLLYRETRAVKIGEVERFKIRYTPEQVDDNDGNIARMPPDLWVKVRNCESLAFRAAFIAGPHVLYVDCTLDDYDQNQKCFVTADQPVFVPQLQPGQSFYAQLCCHTLKPEYSWKVDIVSQIIFNTSLSVNFEIMIGTSKEILHDASSTDKDIPHKYDEGLFCSTTLLTVFNQSTLDLWNLPQPDPQRPIHLVILTHGLHSNVSADMLYLKELIDKACGDDNVVVKGYFGNAGKTERGVKYLGCRVAEYIVELVTKNETFNNRRVNKISFIGHSLGGLIQTFAISYLQYNFPWFFQQIQPINFITVATPLLGVYSDNPLYVKIALLAGIVGKTGQDLSLKDLEQGGKPLLYLLPTGPTHIVLEKFKRRTVYANVVNDGVVPLRTASLMFLDCQELLQLIEKSEEEKKEVEAEQQPIRSKAASFLPLTLLISFFLPHIFSTTNNGNGDGQTPELLVLPDVNDVDDDVRAFQATDIASLSGRIKKLSMLETASSLILPPLPESSFILDPKNRDGIIVHDKIYGEGDLPTKSRELLDDLQNSSTEKRYELLEEEIARQYHTNMKWRKVLIRLKPDAHNNAVVRRRFANAYGWPVVDHLVKAHFVDIDMEDNASQINPDPIDYNLDLTPVLSRDLNLEKNKAIEKECLPSSSSKEDEISEKAVITQGTPDEHQWINNKGNAESLFAVGPTGLLADVGDMVDNFSQWYNSVGLRLLIKSPATVTEDKLEIPEGRSVIGDFI